MVAAERDDAWEGFARQALTFCVGGGLGLAREEGVVAFFDLLEGVRVVVGSDGDVTAVEHRGPAMERVCVQGHVVSAAGAEFVWSGESVLRALRE